MDLRRPGTAGFAARQGGLCLRLEFDALGREPAWAFTPPGRAREVHCQDRGTQPAAEEAAQGRDPGAEVSAGRLLEYPTGQWAVRRRTGPGGGPLRSRARDEPYRRTGLPRAGEADPGSFSQAGV